MTKTVRAGSAGRTAPGRKIRRKSPTAPLSAQAPATSMKMAERLSKGGCEKTEQQELIDEESVHSSLIDCLFAVGKNSEGGSRASLDALWKQVLDHLYAVLNLINSSPKAVTNYR